MLDTASMVLLRKSRSTTCAASSRQTFSVVYDCRNWRDLRLGRTGRGRIVNVSSVAGRVSALGGGAYHASKFAVEALADALRPEVEPFGIDVVNVLPGPISTRFEAVLLKSIPDTGVQSPYFLFKERSRHRMHEFLQPGAFGVMTAETVAAIIFEGRNRKASVYTL